MRRGLLVLCCLSGAVALDLKWIPAHADGPLPMSAKFRDQLRKLCAIEKLPPSIPKAKRAVIRKMCKQLKEADSRTTLELAAENGSPLVFLACLAGTILYLYSQQQQATEITDPKAPTESATSAQTSAAREARLKMYEERPKLTEQQQQILTKLKRGGGTSDSTGQQ
jgi:hypothetical protein